MATDPTSGWEAAATAFLAARSDIGAQIVTDWAITHLPAGAAILDVGAGTGKPIAVALAQAGFRPHAIDPSPSMIANFENTLPGAPARCEPVETSTFFGQRFDAAIAIGLIFLLTPRVQRLVIGRLGEALTPGGQLLFTAPAERWAWRDTLTGRVSVSLGKRAYDDLLSQAGFTAITHFTGDGGNHYFHAAGPALDAGVADGS
ncbi:MAG: class I SAM-dependent methyltransferase [Pseudomonadota bacterium]